VGDNTAGQDQNWEIRGNTVTEALSETWGALAEVCHALVTNEWQLPTECPGWTVQDQLSHLIGIESALRGQAEPAWDGPLGEHVKNDFAAGNEKWIAMRRSWPGDVVLDEFRTMAEQRLGALRALTGQEWAAVGWTPRGDAPMVTAVEVRVFDSWVHEQDVRRALDRPGGVGGQASAIALNAVQGAMPMVVGKRAKAPEGSVVRFEVLGPGEDGRRFTIGVENGRAKELDEAVDPQVTLIMSGVDFTRLGCGRATSEQVEAAGGLQVVGDQVLGHQVLAAMNFMF
jgi:uncharacterized protein (TIGR03083 family)